MVERASTSSTAPLLAAVVCNPVNVDTDAVRAVIDAEAERSGWAPSLWFETTIDDSGQTVTAKALASNPDLLIVVGGDGTIRAVAETAHGRGVPLAVIPAGTGNLLARNLKLPLGDVAQSARVAFAGVDRSIDIARVELTRGGGEIERHIFLVMAGIGLDASMAANTNARMKKRFGWLAYSDPIAKSVFRNHQIRMYYRLDDDRMRRIRAHTVIVGNCGTLTANILLLPDAKIDDGLLDVVVLSPKGLGGWVLIGARLALHRFLHGTKSGKLALQLAPELRALQYAQARALHADFDRPKKVQLDGDNFGFVTSVTISVQPGGVTIRVPRPRTL